MADMQKTGRRQYTNICHELDTNRQTQNMSQKTCRRFQKSVLQTLNPKLVLSHELVTKNMSQKTCRRFQKSVLQTFSKVSALVLLLYKVVWRRGYRIRV